jgi:hypothetical protein
MTRNGQATLTLPLDENLRSKVLQTQDFTGLNHIMVRESISQKEPVQSIRITLMNTAFCNEKN